MASSEATDKCTASLPANFCGYIPISAPTKKLASLPEEKLSDCEVFTTSQQSQVLVCRKDTGIFDLKIGPSALFAALALAISVYSLIYTLSKDTRARKQSIRDDFWLRKVLLQSTIEPLIAFVQDVEKELSHDLLDVKLQLDEAQKKAALTSIRQLESRARTLMGNFSASRLLNNDLQREIKEQLEEVEGILAIYGGAADQFFASEDPNASPPGNREAIEDIQELQLRIFAEIKQYQESL